MKVVRFALIALAGLLSLFLIGQHFGLSSATCNAYCEIIRSWPLSKLISILSLAGTLALGHAVINDLDRRFMALSLIGAGIAIGLQIFAIVREGVCPGCMALAFVIVGLAMTNMKPALLGGLGIPVAGFGLFVLYDSTPMAHPPPTKMYLSLRPYEETPVRSSTGFVIFADPESPSCRDLSITESNLDPGRYPVYYRWYLLPSSSVRTLRAAICIEGISDESWELGRDFRRRLYAKNKPLTDAVIIDVAKAMNIESKVAALLSNPPEGLLQRVEADRTFAEKARVDQAPMVLVLAPDSLRLSSGSVVLVKRTAELTTLNGNGSEPIENR